MPSGEAAPSPPLQAQKAWHQIVTELGYPGGEGQPGKRPQGPAVRAELESLGAAVEELELQSDKVSPQAIAAGRVPPELAAKGLLKNNFPIWDGRRFEGQ